MLMTWATGAFAAPVQTTQIPTEAKWAFHLDVDQLQKSPLGETLAQKFLDPQLGAFSDQIKKQFGIDLNWRKIHSITAFGDELQKKPEDHAVVMISSDLPLRESMASVLSAIDLQASGDAAKAKDVPIKKIESGAADLYSIQNEAFGSITTNNVLILGKSREAVTHAITQVHATAAAKTTAKTTTAAPNESIVWLNLSEHFYDGLELPPQAQILKKTEGASLSLGSAAENLVAKLALKAKSLEIVEQLQQALQGVVAMASLGLAENPTVSELLKTVKIEKEDRTVNLAIQYPLADAMNFLDKKKTKKVKKEI